jgi:AraC-like DNA-binding protein
MGINMYQKGSLILHADQQEITGTVGDFFLIRDSMLHGFTPQTDCIYECLLFDLHSLFRGSETFQKFLRPVYRLELLPNILYHKTTQPELYALADALMKTHSCRHYDPDHTTPNYHELVTVSELSLFFAQILQNKLFTKNEKSDIPVPHRIGQIRAVLEYIEQHYSSNITLSSMASVAGMNPKYFCRIFKEVTQQTPMDYVIFYRVEQAAEMLINTDLSVLEIAMECGFNDYSYFIRTFKKLKSATPKQYRGK